MKIIIEYKQSECFISKHCGDISYCGAKRNNASSSFAIGYGGAGLKRRFYEARKAGLTIAQIAIQTGVGRTTIKAWLKDTDGRIIVI